MLGKVLKFCKKYNILKYKSASNEFCSVAHEEYMSFIAKHPLKSSNIPVVMAPIYLYSDDMSGNRSKKWNKFDAWCTSLACLPKEYAQDIYLLCCSNRTNAVQMSEPLVNDLLSLEKGICVYDYLTKSDILVLAPVISILCNNVVNHLGSTAIKLCRICNTSDGSVIGQLRSKENELKSMAMIAAEPTEQRKNILRKTYGLRENPNPLFKLSVDFFKSTPVESLHTILLGACKYLLRQFMKDRSSAEKKKYWLESMLSHIVAFHVGSQEILLTITSFLLGGI
uniref:Uncharacterized protein n=1 Tax=Amphimedon queenslandica TaxID=400682 RepID=A0A1X7V5E9_AMPQE